ncbi:MULTISPECIES: fimbrial biogenesis chaperone [Cupriavidus]|uniref:Molecular chaperone n=2 Tax=Cupriavidus TaxID=106589 RepID=A0A5M8A8K0_9BURK|nr:MULTISPECIES: molecular chaperone [Cupriavidus]KAA0178587.1 molecular chaperone [Cupriavidus gilardii]KAA6119543.1 molecular chaperone [Cupriavidus cauae]KAB0594215.1 molecular chaperone [Cupriavidus gilardii]NNH12964.1 molecular chaperone [Cupriavidus gilardii]UXC38818.1 molecular chaperone [Cupriavidus gilardii]
MLASAAHGAALQISPIRIDMPTAPGAGALILRNQGDTPIHAQVRVFRWTQSGLDDVLEPTDTVVASPPIVRIAPGEEQLVRVVHPHTAASAAETSYRLLIDELPQSGPPAAGVRVQLRYSVPVFVGTPQGIPPALQFTLRQDSAQWRLEARNGGNRHAQISDVTLVAQSGAKLAVTRGLLGYALAGSGRQWALPADYRISPSTSWRLEASVNGVRITAAVRVAAPGEAGSADAR